MTSAKLNATYSTYARVGSRCGLTGAEAAERLLRSQGIYDVAVRRVSGHLTDHYDPRTKTVNLSDAVYGATSIAAIGVAAHECGHAMQDAGEYVPLRLRAALVPVANFGAQISWPLILIGFFMGGGFLVDIGILLFSPCSKASGFHWDSSGSGSGAGKKGIRRSCLNLCSCCSSFHPPAPSSASFIRKQRQG